MGVCCGMCAGIPGKEYSLFVIFLFRGMVGVDASKGNLATALAGRGLLVSSRGCEGCVM